MKLASILLLSMILIALSTIPVLANNINGQGCENKLACGSTLSSAAGFGAVELCGNCAVCGADDGICPEDFYSGGVQGSCASCPDPQCTATLSGYVFYGSAELPIPNNAEIKARYHPGEAFRTIAQTTTGGMYLEHPMAANSIELFATYNDTNGANINVYNSEKITVDLSRGEEKEINFTLSPAQCEQDCTREGNNICDATCQGKNNCTFANNAKYTSNYTKTILDGYVKEEKVTLNSTIDCNITNTITEDIATACVGPITQKVSNYPIGVCGNNASGGNITQFQVIQSDDDKESLITKTVRVYTEDGRMAILTIVYWEGEKDN